MKFPICRSDNTLHGIFGKVMERITRRSHIAMGLVVAVLLLLSTGNLLLNLETASIKLWVKTETASYKNFQMHENHFPTESTSSVFLSATTGNVTNIVQAAKEIDEIVKAIKFDGRTWSMCVTRPLLAGVQVRLG